MPKQFQIKIEPVGKDRFCFGNCATIALAQALNKTDADIVEEFSNMNVRAKDGVTTLEIGKLIKNITQKRNFYFSNKTHISLKSFAERHQKGTYLINLDNHLSYLKDGVFYDEWFYSWLGAKTREEILKISKFMGWWEIKDNKKSRIKSSTRIIWYTTTSTNDYCYGV